MLHCMGSRSSTNAAANSIRMIPVSFVVDLISRQASLRFRGGNVLFRVRDRRRGRPAPPGQIPTARMRLPLRYDAEEQFSQRRRRMADELDRPAVLRHHGFQIAAKVLV